MKTCFIVDTNKEFLIFIERNLTLLGYQVSLFPDTKTLIDALKQKPQVVIVGDNFGDSQSILDCIVRVRSYLPKSAIIHVAQYTQPDQAEQAIHAGATEFIEKNSATFVRLRTAMDLLNTKNQKPIASFLANIKKAFTRE